MPPIFNTSTLRVGSTLVSAAYVGSQSLLELPPTGILRTVAANNAVNNGTATVAGRNRVCVRVPYIIGSGDVSELVLSHYAWNMTTGGFANNANAFTITLTALENSAGTVSVPVLYAGLRPTTISANGNDLQSDAVLPAAFSLSKFSRGDIYWLKMQIDITAGQFLPNCTSFRNTSVTGTQFLWFDSAATTITNGVDTPGVFTTSGTAPSSQTLGYMPVLLGKFTSGDPTTCIGAGDSVLNSVNDSTTTPWGMGMFHRAMYSDGTPSNVMAGLNWSKPSGFSTPFRTQVTVYGWSKYAKVAIEEFGLNDLGTNGDTITTATFKSQLSAVWTNLRGQGIEKIFRTKLIGRITSTDLFVTEANQTPNGIWDTSAADMNAYFDAQIGTGINGVIPFDAMHGVNPLRWKVDGSANYATVDGVHPTPALHANQAIELRAILDAA